MNSSRLNIYLTITLLSSFFLYSCSEETQTEEQTTNASEEIVNTPRGEEDVLRLAIGSDYEELNPKYIRSLVGANLAYQVYEGLVKLDAKTLEVEPALATYDISSDRKTYTFSLREDAYFHDSPIFPDGKGRLVTAQDVVASYNYYCQKTGEKENAAYNTGFKGLVVGADDCYRGKSESVSGIRAEGNKVIIELTSPSLTFLQRMAGVPGLVLPVEAIKAGPSDHVIGSGPFTYAGGRDQGKALFAKNPNYYLKNEKGEQLPLLDSVIVSVINGSGDQLALFEAGQLHFIDGLPINRVKTYIPENMDKISSGQYELKQTDEMSTQYYEFNLTREHFKDPRVRQAINYAIDREKIVTKVLNGQASGAGHYGITPPLRKDFKEYDFEGIEAVGYKFDPDKAHELMAAAGYPNGEGFPDLEMEYNQDNTHAAVAEEISIQLAQNLGINVKLSMVSFEKKMDDAAYARKDLIRSAWVADYPSPETFLINGYGKLVPSSLSAPSDLNSMRYVSAEFDRHFEAGMNAATEKEQYRHFAKAEKVFLKDAPIIPLWYQMDYKLMDGRVKNFHTNTINRWDFSETSIEADPES